MSSRKNIHYYNGEHPPKHLFADKNIALVGNALSLFDRDYGREIDNHDLVIRMNRAAMFYTAFESGKSHGKRTDGWFVWNYREYEHCDWLKKPNIIVHMASWEDPQTNECFIYSPVRSALMMNRLKKATPSTGFLSIDLLIDSGPKKISLYGFDWKQTPTFTDKTGDIDTKLGQVKHNFNLEKKYVLEELKPNHPELQIRT